MLALGFSGAARASSPYASPFTTADYYVGRTDMGVDACLSPGDPIAAMGDGVVVGIQHDWFDHQPYIWYQLTGGPDAGRYVYVAEQITHLAAVGDRLHAGQTIARYAKKGTCIETGWSAADGETLASATTGYTEGEVTPAGISFARFLIAQGVQGSFELSPPRGQTAKHRKTRKAKKPARPPRTAPTPAPSPAPAPNPPEPSYVVNHPSGGGRPWDPGSTGGTSGAQSGSSSTQASPSQAGTSTASGGSGL